MITRNQRYMLNYALDHTFYIFGQELISLGSYRDRSNLATYFNNYLNFEVEKDVEYYVTRGEPIDSFRPGARELVTASYFAAMRDFVDKIGNTLIASKREHRIKLREFFKDNLKRRILARERIIEGKEKALQHIRQERERLQHGE